MCLQIITDAYINKNYLEGFLDDFKPESSQTVAVTSE
jgi:hypothetical protein